jgi:hypothetical protein
VSDEAVHPIRPEVEIKSDMRRELADFAARAVKEFAEEPVAVVVVTFGVGHSRISTFRADRPDMPNRAYKALAAAFLTQAANE